MPCLLALEVNNNTPVCSLSHCQDARYNVSCLNLQLSQRVSMSCAFGMRWLQASVVVKSTRTVCVHIRANLDAVTRLSEYLSHRYQAQNQQWLHV